MKIDIKFTQIDPTPSIKTYIETKLKAIEKLLPLGDEDAAELFVDAARISRHHHKGNIYMVSVYLDSPHKKYRAQEEGSDLRKTVDAVRHSVKFALEKQKNIFAKGKRHKKS